jgi:hypothetical protein
MATPFNRLLNPRAFDFFKQKKINVLSFTELFMLLLNKKRG